MAGEMRARCIADVAAELGEGPVWVAAEQALYWVDIKGRKLFRLADGKVEEFETLRRIGSIAPRQGGGFIAGTDQGIAFFDPAFGKFEPIADPEPDRATNRFNDGKVDRAGRFWAGSMDDEEKKASGALYRVDADLACTRMDDDYRVTNGPAFSPDGRTMYVSDSALQVTYAFDLDPDGEASNRRVFARFREDEGYPDGMTVDSEGFLWIAFWDGWCVRKLSPDGRCVETIAMPIQRPTSCAFGGPDLATLYVTSARTGLDEDALAVQPNGGGLFMIEAGVRGIEELPFAG